jgi:hypothetical protein
MAGVIAITLPAAPPPTTNVRVGAVANQGSICAKGTTSDPVIQVWAQIYNVGDTPPSVPPTGAVTVLYPGGSTSWSFEGGAANEIPNAKCAASPSYVPNQLAIWVKYPDGTIELHTQLFNGVCSTTSDCG